MNSPLSLLRRLHTSADLGSDADLVGRFVADRDQAAFAELARRHGPTVWRVCRRSLSNAADAEDAFQATFIVFAERARRLRDRSAVSAWLHGVALRVSRRAAVQARRRTEREADSAIRPADEPLAEVRFREVRAILDEELDRLPEKERAAVILCCLRGRTRDEAADQLGVPLGTLKSRLHSGRERLRVRLERRGLTISSALSAALISHATATAVPELSAAPSDAVRAIAGSAFCHPVRTVCLAMVTVLALGTLGAWALSDADTQPESDDPPAEPAGNVDRFGDPLPDGAVARLGTVRFRGASSFSPLATYPDGSRIAAADYDSITVWDAASGRAVRRWRVPPEAPVARGQVFGPGQTAIAVSPDGKRLASGGQDGRVHIWDAGTGKLLRTFAAHGAPPGGAGPFPNAPSVDSLRFTGDGERLASLGQDRLIRTWDVTTGRRIGGFEIDDGWSCQFSADGRLALLTAEVPEGRWTLEVREVATGKALLRRVLPPGGRPLVILTRDASRLVLYRITEPDAATFEVWDLPSGEIRRRWELNGAPSRVAVSPDGQTLAWTGDADDTKIRLIRTDSGQAIRQLEVGALNAYGVTFLGEGTLLSRNFAGTPLLWDVNSGEPLLRREGHASRVSAVRFAPAGRRISTATGSSSTVGMVWDVASRKPISEAIYPTWLSEALTLSPDGRMMASAHTGGLVQVRRLSDGNVVAKFEVGTGQHGLLVSFAPGGRLVTVSGQTVRVHDIANREALRELTSSGRSLNDIAVSPDGRLLAVANGAGKKALEVWDLATGKPVEFDWGDEPDGSGANAVAFSPDGRMIALAQYSDKVRVWEVASRRLRRTIDHPADLSALAFAPDGRLLLTGTSTTQIRFSPFTPGERVVSDPPGVFAWDLYANERAARLLGHLGGVKSLDVSRDGEYVASGSFDTTVLIWDLRRIRENLRATAGPLTERRLGELWATLAKPDAAAAYDAIVELASDPERSVPFLKDKLAPVKADPEEVASWIEDLSSPKFAVREKATAELSRLGPAVVPTLRDALEKTTSAEAERRLQRLIADLSGVVRINRAREVLGIVERMPTR